MSSGQITDPKNFPRLLRFRRRAKCKEHYAKSKHRDFFPHVFSYVFPHSSLDTRHSPPSHLITLSAFVSVHCGIVRPICLAVLRLITNSNLIGCSTGMSAGLVPLRILST